jgi:hypothetical protein
MRDSDPLDREIRALVRELVESAPAAPPVPSGHLVDARRRSPHRALAISLPLSLLIAGAAAASITALARTGPGVDRMFLRVTTGGVAIRAYGPSSGAGEPQIEVGLSSRDAVGTLTGVAVTNPPGRDWFYPVVSTVFGHGATGASATLVSVGPDVATVRATFASGATDSMHPVAGWAVLAVPGTSGAGRLVGLNASGYQVGEAAIPRPTPSGEGFLGESTPTFVRTTAQGVLVIGHTVRSSAHGARWLYPYLADRASVQVGLEGIPACRPRAPRAVVAGALEVDADQGEPMAVVVVHAGVSVARVRVRFANGVADAMSPVAGQAVLVTVGTIGTTNGHASLARAVLQAFSADGRLISSRPISLRDTPYASC